jgi:hypothetical protein
MDEIMSNMGHHFAINANIGSVTFELISEKQGKRNFQAVSPQQLSLRYCELINFSNKY